MDKRGGDFFCQRVSDTFKYHVAKMDTLCRPENQGGIGMLNTRIMNECMLTKWIWKIMKVSEETWYKLLKAKYMPDGNFDSRIREV